MAAPDSQLVPLSASNSPRARCISSDLDHKRWFYPGGPAKPAFNSRQHLDLSCSAGPAQVALCRDTLAPQFAGLAIFLIPELLPLAEASRSTSSVRYACW